MEEPSISRSNVLIEAVLRLTARLIATLATLDGELADLSSMGQHLRYYVARELGPPRHRIALVANAFGVSETTIYSWRRKAMMPPDIRRTDRDWILSFLREKTRNGRPIGRDVLEKQFVEMASEHTQAKGDDALATSTVLQIYQRFEAALWLLSKADLVLATTSDKPLYFAPSAPDEQTAIEGLVWLEIFERASITPIALDELATVIAMDRDALIHCLDALVSQRRIVAVGDDRAPLYHCSELYLPIDDDKQGHSLEVAALDHLKVVIDTIIDRFEHRSITTGRLSDERREQLEALRQAFDVRSGMVSWRFDMWPDHPQLDEILAIGERLVALGHQLSVENRLIEGEPSAERVVYVGMHTRGLKGTSNKEDPT